MVAPAYIDDSFVDHELSANLDSTFAFEGPEKLLELWFWESESHLPQGFSSDGLRSIPFECWVRILDLVNCKILSMKSNNFMDAYLLSESSLFVFPHKMILKTCGTTTTLDCLDALFEIVRNFYFKNKEKFNGHSMHKVFYSRRSFMFPEKQKLVHRDWKFELAVLDKHFENGKSYILGDYNSDDHWYLYVAGEEDFFVTNDQTFEILMTELNPKRASQFETTRQPGVQSLINDGVSEHDLGHDIGIETMKSSGLDEIFSTETFAKSHLPSPASGEDFVLDCDTKDSSNRLIHDAFSFTPCGFSSNSISLDKGGYYYTLHVTPEDGWSYASFETNYSFSDNSEVDTIDVLLKVLKVFNPGRFSVTLINENAVELNSSFAKLQNCDETLRSLGYKKRERVLYDLKSKYRLLYLNFETIKNCKHRAS